MKKKVLKRLLSLTLAVFMAFSMQQTTSFAAELDTTAAVAAVESEETEDTVLADITEGQNENDSSEENVQEVQPVEVEEDDTCQLNGDAQTEEYVYYMMNIPYSVFYKNIVGETNSAAVDIVSSATTQKSRSAQNTYYKTENTVKENGTDILGVVAPVKMTETTYETIKELVTDSNADYYIGEQVTSPKAYISLDSYSEGTYSFGQLAGKEKKTESVAATISSASTWGDYEIDLTDSSMGLDASTVYGAYITTTDGTRYALRQLENLWTPSNYYEIAFSTGHKTTEPHGGVLYPDHYASMEGKSVASASFITSKGIIIYEFANSLLVASHATSTLETTVNDAFSISLAGIPEDAADVKVDVYTGSRAKTYLASSAAVSDGKVALTAGILAGTEYTVAVSSSNYATITGTFKATEEQVAGDYYLYQNLSYDKFFKVSGVNNDVEVDIVSSATTNKSRSCSNVYMKTEDTVISGGTDILGVVMPVKMSYESYISTAASITDSTAEYYVSGIVETEPTTYFNFDGTNYTLVGSTTTKEDVEATISSSSKWGDYEIDLKDSDLGIDPTLVYGAYITAADGTSYAMKQSENLWNPHNYFEFAWSTAVLTNEPHGGILSTAHYASMEGKSITSITYVTKNGLVKYSLKDALKVLPHYSTSVDCELVNTKEDNTDVSKLTFKTVPEDLENAKVSVYTGTRQKTYVLQDADLSSSIDLTSVAKVGTEYTVVITSSNYAAITTQVSVGSYISEIAKQTYTGSAIKPALSVYNKGVLLTEKTDYTVTFRKNVNVGTATAIVTFKGNYSGSLTADFEIVAKDITGIASINDIYKKASSKNIKVSPTVKVAGKTLKLNTDYTLSSATVPGNAGVNEITVTGKGNYTGTATFKVNVIGTTTATGLKDISKMSISKIANQTFTGKAVTLDEKTLIVKNKLNVVDEDCYTLKYLNNSAIGTATVIIIGNEEEGYTGFTTKTFKIVATPITSENLSITYSATEINYGEDVTVAITSGSGRSMVTLSEGTDYVVTKTNFGKPGTASIKITGIGLYSGNTSKKITIKANALEETSEGLSISVEESATYNPKGSKAAVTVSYKGTTLVENKDYTLSYANNKKLSTETSVASVTIKGKNGYSFKTGKKAGIVKTFNVVKSSLSNGTVKTADFVAGKALSKNTAVYVYDEYANKLTTKAYKLVYMINGEEVAASEKPKAGDTVTVKAVALDNSSYTGETSSVSLNTYDSKNNISKATVKVSNQKYTGKEITLVENDITVTLGKNNTLKYGTDYVITGYSSNVKAGTANVTIKGIGLYGGTKTVSFKITKREATK